MEKKMSSSKTHDESNKLLKEAYKCKPGNLKPLLQKIESEIKNSSNIDSMLLRAKLVVTSKIASTNSK
jgi:hypothetical protein